MTNESETNWSDVSYTLKELIKNFTLPQLVMVEEGYMLNETESLSSGQLITVQSYENVTQFKGTDSDGKAVTLPVNCPFKIKLVAKDEDRIYKGVGDLCRSLERPKYVEVKSSKARRDLGLVKNGDRLKILLTERGPNGPTYLHFRNQRGKHLRLPVDFSCDFRGCAEDDSEHLLNDLIGKDFPLHIKFIDSQNIGDSIGIIELNECMHDTLVFASTKHQGRLFATAFPISLDVKVRTMEKTMQTKPSAENIYESAMHKIDVDKFREFMDRDKTIHESGYVFFAPMEAIKEKNQITAETLEKSEITPTVVNEYETPVNSVNDKTRIKSKGFLSRVRLKFRGNKTNRKSQEMRPEIIIIDRLSGASSDGGDSGIYEQIPADTYVSMDIIDGVRRKIKAPKKSVTRKKSLITKTQSSGAPPPLPGNHPLERRHTYSAKTRSSLQQRKSASSSKESSLERDNFKKFYDTMKKSEHEILSCDLEGVSKILRELKIERHAKKFQDNQIDGKLLVDLDEAVFKDIGLTPFEARKLRKYVFGWRPDNAKTDVNYSSNYSSDYADKSEALRWSENEVAEHLTNLGLNEFRVFCERNQVNGDLLWDMVVDEEIIYGLLSGSDRRLNAVKLKNYVTEGWRPKLIKKRANSMNYGTLEKRTGRAKSFNEEITPSKPHPKNSKQQTRLTQSTKDDATLAVKQPSTSSQSDAMSPASSNSERLSLTGSGKSVSRPKSRLQAKVTYPKNSPYAKSDTAKKLDDSNSQTGLVSQQKFSGSNDRSSLPDSVQEKAPGATANKQIKKGPTSIVEQTCKSSTVGRKSSQSSSIDKKNTSVVAKENDKQTEAVTTNREKGASSVKQERSQRSIFHRGKNATSCTSKNRTVSKKPSVQSETSSSLRQDKTGASDNQKRKSVGAKGKAAIEEEKKKNDENVGGNPKELKQPSCERSTVKCDSGEVQSPSIASLRKQYESNAKETFKDGEKLRRSGRNDLSRTAIKRKDSNAKQDNHYKVRPVTSVAHLKKQFDSKPML